jgi:hypothetical protein
MPDLKFDVFKTLGFFVCFLVYWSLDSESQAGALPLELLSHPSSVLGIFKIRSHKLFAWAGFEP